MTITLETAIAQKTGETVELPYSNGTVCLLTANDEAIEILFMDANGHELAGKRYVNSGWAARGVRALADRLGLVPLSAATEVRKPSGSIWKTTKIDTYIVDVGGDNIELKIVTEDGKSKVSFIIGGILFSETFSSEREARQAGLAKLNSLAAWAVGPAPCQSPHNDNSNRRRKSV